MTQLVKAAWFVLFTACFSLPCAAANLDEEYQEVLGARPQNHLEHDVEHRDEQERLKEPPDITQVIARGIGLQRHPRHLVDQHPKS